ncbi:MAG: diguanylate cyclase, partial [Bacilli bacterium]|nr:diguanylate cyclase [Bacilli bacterium]
GRKVTATNDLEALYNIVYENLSILMSSTTFGIAIHSDSLNALQYQYLIVDEERMENHFASLENKNSLAVQCFIQNRSLVFRTRDDIKNVLHQAPSSTIGNVMNSMMFVPLVIEDKAIGIITIQNRADHAYNEQSLKTLETLAAYIAIAIRNTQKNNALKAEIEEKSSIQNELAKLNKELQDLSEIDGLTGIANRRHFDEFYEYEFKRCLRSNEWISLMMLDIDHFKEYNDHYGHLQGDEIIILIAKLIAKHAKRSSDLAVRFGGDEFIVVLSNTAQDVANRIALDIQKEISKLALLHEHSPIASTITLSIGIASLIPNTESSTNELLDKADQALYKAKGNGRNKIQIYKEST